MKIIVLACTVFFGLCAANAQQPVILTENAQTLGASRMMLGVGAEFLSKQDVVSADDPQSEWRVAAFALRLGIAENVNFDVEWKGGLIARTPDERRGYDWGDLTVATKINVRDEKAAFPALGVRSAVKLPNTSYLPYKLGNDQTDYYFHLLASKHFGQVELRFNAGLGIVGDPRGLSPQDDIYSGSAVVTMPIEELSRAFVELYGFTGHVANAQKLLVRGGVIVQSFGLQWGVYGSRRVLGNSYDFGSAFEASQDWSAGMFVAKSLEL